MGTKRWRGDRRGHGIAHPTQLRHRRRPLKGRRRRRDKGIGRRVGAKWRCRSDTAGIRCKLNRIVYPAVNNGVYRCGFAQTQEAYEVAVKQLFNTLDMLEEHLGIRRYLCGVALALADVCLFTTLVRFDLVYHGLCKCSKKKLTEYPNLHAYTRDIYQIPNVAEMSDFEAIMDGYYKILFPLNPDSIKPFMPSGCEHEALSTAHNRELLTLPSNSLVIT